MFDDLQMYQTWLKTIKHDQTAPNKEAKLFGHQTMFDGVWSPNISCFGQAFTYG